LQNTEKYQNIVFPKRYADPGGPGGPGGPSQHENV